MAKYGIGGADATAVAPLEDWPGPEMKARIEALERRNERAFA